MKRILIFIAGTKGGVGKSFATVMLAGAVADLNLSFKVFDTDNENKTTSQLLKKNTKFLDETKTNYPLDEVINSLYNSNEQITIVDMKAGTSRSTQEWFASVPWDKLRELELDVYIAGCITSNPDSSRTFVPWAEYFKEIGFPVKYLLVKNEKDGDDFYTCTHLLEPAMDNLNLQYTKFYIPTIEQEYINILDNHNLTLRRHMIEEQSVLSTIMQKSRLRKHYLTITDPMLEFFLSCMNEEEINSVPEEIMNGFMHRNPSKAEVFQNNKKDKSK